MINGKEVMKYWDIERPRYKLEQGPKWLSIDEATGKLSGQPDRLGRSEVIVSVTLERERRSLDPARLQWGVEEALTSGIESVGTAKQVFSIVVAP
jgi:hypothetical protein